MRLKQQSAFSLPVNAIGPVLMISGHSIHPEHALIEHTLKVNEAEMMGMRSLTTSMHLAQCLVMGLLHRQEKQ